MSACRGSTRQHQQANLPSHRVKRQARSTLPPSTPPRSPSPFPSPPSLLLPPSLLSLGCSSASFLAPAGSSRSSKWTTASPSPRATPPSEPAALHSSKKTSSRARQSVVALLKFSDSRARSAGPSEHSSGARAVQRALCSKHSRLCGKPWASPPWKARVFCDRELTRGELKARTTRTQCSGRSGCTRVAFGVSSCEHVINDGPVQLKLTLVRDSSSQAMRFRAGTLLGAMCKGWA